MDSNKLAYIGAIIDGEGCILIGKRRDRNRIRYQPVIFVTSKDKMLVEFLNQLFPGSIVVFREIYYQWILTGLDKIKNFLIAIIPYLLIKKEQAQFLLEYVKSRENNYIRGQYERGYTSEEISLYERIKKLKKEYPSELPAYNFTEDEKWYYVAGLIDGEGSVRIAKAVHRNSYGNEKLILTPQISIANTDKRLMEFLTREFGGFIVEKKREGKWRTLYQWHMQGLKEDFFKKLNGKLVIKQPQLSLILKYVESRKFNYTRENEIEIFLKMQKLNKKGKENYDYENLKHYTSLIRNPRKLFIEKDKLKDLYTNKKLSIRQIARLFNVAFDTVRLRLIRYKIPLRNFKEGIKLNPPKLTEKGRKVISEAASKNKKEAWQDSEYRKKMEKILELARMKRNVY